MTQGNVDRITFGVLPHQDILLIVMLQQNSGGLNMSMWPLDGTKTGFCVATVTCLSANTRVFQPNVTRS